MFFRFLTVIGGKNIYLRVMITNKDCSKEKKYDESFWKTLKDEVIVLCLLFDNVPTCMLFNYCIFPQLKELKSHLDTI